MLSQIGRSVLEEGLWRRCTKFLKIIIKHFALHLMNLQQRLPGVDRPGREGSRNKTQDTAGTFKVKFFIELNDREGR